MFRPIEATKFYVRHREGYPETEVMDSMRRGFWSLSVETPAFEWVDDINDFNDLGPTVGIAGYIGDVHYGLKKLGCVIPENVDYPPELAGFMGRNIRLGTLEEVRRSIHPVFVKPVQHKAFTGFVWKNDPESRRRIVVQEESTPVWISDPIEIIAEYHSFILHQEILDCRLYKGDWSKAPSKSIVRKGVDAMWKVAPAAYCLDWGVTADGETILVEMNEGYAFGGYGIHPTYHARMLSARWFEMTGGLK